MIKTLLLIPTKLKGFPYLVLIFSLSFIQKSEATTFYINDKETKGDIYTTVIGDDSNDGFTPSNPKLNVRSAYEKAQDGDTIIIDTGSYKDLSQKGEVLFVVSKKITFIIAGISDAVFQKIPLPTNLKVNSPEVYIDKDKAVDRKTYLKKQDGEIKKP